MGKQSKHTTRLLATVAVCAAATFLVPQANAVMLKFDDEDGPSGSLSYDGAGGPLVGTDISFDSILGEDTPMNDGVFLTIEEGILNFVTGDNIMEGPNMWTFGDGGSFVLTGSAWDSSTSTLIASGTLLQGTFTGTPTVLQGGGNIGFFNGAGVDTKNAAILAYYDIPDQNFRFAHTVIDLNTFSWDANGGLTANVDNADLVNQAVPDGGATVMLLGATLLGLSVVHRKKSGGHAPITD